MDVVMIVGLVLFLIQVVAWALLPNAKQLAEGTAEFSSIGDEVKSHS